MFNIDEKRNFEEKRDLVEYNASFINPESVNKIRNFRDSDGDIKSTDKLSDEEALSKIKSDKLISDIGKKFKKNKGTNNNDLNEPLSNIESPLYKIIRDK